MGEGHLSALNGVINTLQNTLNGARNAPPEQFIQNRQSYIDQLNSQIENFRTQLVPFLVYSQEQFRKKLGAEHTPELEDAKSYIKTEADGILARLKTEADVILRQASERANTIQSSARQTASGVAQIESQKIFRDLLEHFKTGMLASGISGSAAFAVFVVFSLYLFYATPELATPATAIYHAAIRVTLLGAAAAVVAFATRIFRSNLNMYYHTLHRQQLTSTIDTFIAAARTDEQKDLLLAKLVETVSSLGSSGLISGGDDMPNTAKIIIDALPKVLASRSIGG